jgi:uncharacterized membrane protein YheB (UPF0754 family)
MQLTKSVMTNMIAAALVALSFALEGMVSKVVLMSGLFALSGALTNVLAIHMLFEKVPLLYGSGVIEARFDAFKRAIRELMMAQFFTREQLDAFFAAEEKKLDLTPIIEATDFDPAYDALVKTVMESSFGGMLGMFGGERALEGLREPFGSKMKKAVLKIVQSDAFNDQLQQHLASSSLSDDMIASIEGLIDARLAELTPQMVKEMVQLLIREHLGWLVVWGGVFGGAIGLAGAFVL